MSDTENQTHGPNIPDFDLPTIEPDPYRNPNGTIRPGSKIALNKRVVQLKRVFDECVTAEDMQAAYAKLMEGVKSGDMVAIKEFFDRTLGRPRQAVEVTGGPDGEPARLNISTITAVILGALSDDSEARYKVAAALGALTLETKESKPDGPVG